MARVATNVEQLEAKVSGVNEALSKLITLAPDVNATEEGLKNALQLFEKEILGLRREVRQYTLEIQSATHLHLTTHPVTLSVGPAVVPESAPENPKPKKDKKPSKRKKP